MIAVADLGALLRWVGLLEGDPLPLRRVVSADALLGECIEYLKVRFSGRSGPVLAALTEIQFSVREWYPSWPVAGLLADIATQAGMEIDATLLAPVAIAAETGLTFATTSPELAEAARPHVRSVLLV